MQANVSDYSTLGLSTHSVMNSNLRFSRHQNFTKIQFDSNFFSHDSTNTWTNQQTKRKTQRWCK